MTICQSPLTLRHWCRRWRALSSSRPRRQNPHPSVQGEPLPIIGRSSAMQDIYRLIARLTQTDLTVTIVGESGTGKELVARALHDFSKRKKGPFRCPQHGGDSPRTDRVRTVRPRERGLHGCCLRAWQAVLNRQKAVRLFLDEIGDMPLEAQTRLLRVLQQGEYTTVGGTTPIKTNVRIICATHRDLRQLINQGLFREDLFYRLNVVPLRLPPLRERTEDIPDLVRHFLDRRRQGRPAAQGNRTRSTQPG